MRLPIAATLALFLAACDGGRGTPDIEILQERTGTAKSEGDQLLEVPDFVLLESAGKPIGKQQLLGKVWVASFIFTRCQTHCITTCGEMAKLQDDFLDDDEFVLVATTVDPAHDTAEVLRSFGKKYGAKQDRWYFLTGRREDIRRYAYEGMKISWVADEPLVHSTKFVLVGREGHIRGWFDATDRASLERLRGLARKLLDEKKTP